MQLILPVCEAAQCFCSIECLASAPKDARPPPIPETQASFPATVCDKEPEAEAAPDAAATSLQPEAAAKPTVAEQPAQEQQPQQLSLITASATATSQVVPVQGQTLQCKARVEHTGAATAAANTEADATASARMADATAEDTLPDMGNVEAGVESEIMKGGGS